MNINDKPTSRVEAILQRMLGSQTNIEKPASRVEFLLANVKDLLLAVEDEVERLAGKTTRILYTAKTNPTAQEIDTFVISKGYVSPYEGVAIVVDETYHVWHYYENDNLGWKDDGVDTVTPFTNNLPGSILGSAADGKISANQDGTGSVNGWNDKLDKQTGTTTNPQVYIKNADGTQGVETLTTGNTPDAVVRRRGDGRISCPYPYADGDTTNKKYVDDKLTATPTQLSDGTYSLTFGV